MPSLWDLLCMWVWSILAAGFWWAALMPPINPRDHSGETGCAIVAVITSLAALYCVARLLGWTP